jgi:REP element-mobilizing transposase RayT
MFKVSRDNPAYWMTSVTHKRLSIFQRDEFKKLVTEAYNEAKEKHKFLIFAYVIMLDHTHVITDNVHEMKDILRYLNGVSANKIIKHLKANGYDESLAKLRIQERADKHKHSVYEHHPNAMRITGEDALMQKVNYIHLNPVREGLVDHPDDYLYSSARLWHGRAIEDEPLVTDHKKITWRAA